MPLPASDPSPQFQAYDAIVPSASVDADASTLTTSQLTDVVKLATGGIAGLTETDFVVEPVNASLSVTVRVIVYVPPDAYVWVAVTPLPASDPSPQFQEYDTIVPSVSYDVDASTLTPRQFF